MIKKAVVLNSGGLDSATCLAIARAEGFEICALTFNYGQRHRAEVNAALRLASYFKVAEHRIVTLPLEQWGGSALTDKNIAVPNFSDNDDIPVTYVPARNTIFLSVALSIAEAIGAYDIFTGVNALDYSGYPDCRPEYFEAFEKMATLATKTGTEGKPIRINTPLIHLHKSEIILKGLSLGVDYGQSVTCYQADDQGLACGQCDACEFRARGFKEAGVSDPTQYME